MHLFNQLLNLHSPNKPIENFFTEVVAYFFNKNNEILFEWLKSNSISINENADINIITQMYFERIDTIYPGSQPDITIEITSDNIKDVIFIESKIGSKEGENQLRKYAETLLTLPDVGKKYLIYITRDYEPNISEIKSITSVDFRQLRWYNFYQFIQSYKSTNFVPEIIDFMKGNNMALTNQFTAIDLLSMANFRKTLNLMDASLNEEVRIKMNQVFGNTASGIKQFRQQGRYIIYHPFFKNWDFWCGIGFYNMDSDSFTDYPNIGFNFEVSNRNFPQRSAIIKAMEIFIKEKTNWESFNLHEINAWAGINRMMGMKDLLAKEDHIYSIKENFMEFIKEAEYFKNYNPDLPWGNPPAESDG
jgi:hypothetical protein